ncbi:hypothetical protein BDV98DRAFT_606002 [Pterulicium gracile]|uniref:Uncharacterized protein n=1 Tax=Pterulicium gracile TaxID=1884261 RepID=A0A5C3QEE6_9AGAR|nr:hypothetical protein BDV98DRAFT_606002 [Pterula gracilis]
MFHFLNLLISAMLIFPAIATPLATNTPAIASTNNTLLATVPNPVCDVPATNCPENQDDYLLSWDIVRQFYGPSSAVGLWGRVYFTTCDTCVPITRLDSNDCFEFSYCGNSSIRRRICFDFVNMRAERLLLNANPVQRQCFEMSMNPIDCDNGGWSTTFQYYPTAQVPCT